MAKRVLSLLLALVMALSLCVPAFAAEAPVDEADEVGAEAVEEVVDEAAAEPEAEPAEEPAEEPVDVPETVSVDEPMLVALGVVTKEAHWELYKAVEKAEKLVADAEAGNLRVTSFTAVTFGDTIVKDFAKDSEKYDPFKDETVLSSKTFAETLETAKEYLDGIDGKEVDLDVTTTNVTTAANNLNAYVDASGTKLTAEADATMKVDATIEAYLYDKIKYRACATYHASSSLNTATDSALVINFDGKDSVTTDPNWTKAYQASYLTKLQAAIDAILAYEEDTDQTYAEYKSLVYTILETLALEEAAWKPGSADMTRVNAAIAKAPASEEDYNSAGKTYVLGTTWAQLSNGSKNGFLDKVTALKADPDKQTVAFDPDKTLWEVNEAIKNLEDHLVEVGDPTIRCETKEANAGASTISVTVSVKHFDGDSANKGDGYAYTIAYEVTQKASGETKWYKKDAAGVDTFAEAEKIKLIDDSDAFGTEFTPGTLAEGLLGRLKVTGTLTDLGTSAGTFADGDVVTLHFYTGSNEAGYKEVSSAKINVKTAVTPNPTASISTVTYGFAAAAKTLPAFTPGTTKLIGGSYSTSSWGTGDTDRNVAVVTKADLTEGELTAGPKFQAKLTVGGKSAVASLEEDKHTFKIEVTEEIDKLLTAGKPGKVEIQFATDQQAATDGAWTTIATADVEIKSIKAWTNVETLEDIVEAAEALVASDYKVQDASKKHLKAETDEGKLAEAYQLIQDNAAKIKSIITSSTLGDTQYNHTEAVTALTKMLEVCGYLAKDTTDINEWLLLKAEAEEIAKDIKENEGEGIYTFDTVGAVQDVLDLYDDLTSADLQSDVDAAVEALQDALDGLVKIAEIDKSELEASIKAAEALNEEDYTAESWAALQTALDAAKDVLAMENPTQAQLTNAADKLNKAVAALVKDVDADDLAAAIEAAEAAIADPSKYTEDSVKAVEDAITAAKALGDDATADEIADAIEALDAAVKALKAAEPEEPEIPAAPKGGTGWVQAEDGTYYYYKNNAVVKGDWVKSKGLWYYMDAEGKLLTGLNEISDKYGKAWYFFEDDNSRGTEGRMLTGWVELENAEGAGDWGWFETRSNGHQGQCTYTSTWGDFDGYTKK